MSARRRSKPRKPAGWFPPRVHRRNIAVEKIGAETLKKIREFFDHAFSVYDHTGRFVVGTEQVEDATRLMRREKPGAIVIDAKRNLIAASAPKIALRDTQAGAPIGSTFGSGDRR